MTLELQDPLYVAGNRHYQDRFAMLGEGSFAGVLVREPMNTYDTKAIMVMTPSETKLGYVPKWKAAEWAPRMDEAGLTRIGVEINIRPPDPDKGLYSAELLQVYA